jgi:hypothetical protein
LCRLMTHPPSRTSFVANGPGVILSCSGTIFLAIIEAPGTEGVWELFDAATFDECWMINRLVHLAGSDPRNAKGGLLLPSWGAVVRSGLTLRSVPRGGSAMFKVVQSDLADL